MEIAGIAIDETVDITDKVCPLTFVKAKVALEELDDGEVIAIRMNDGEPVQNVPRSVKEEGHQILKLVDNFEEKVLKNPLPVLVDFYSDSCIPCKQLSPVLGDIEDEREDTLSVYKVNVNYDMELAEKYDVMGVPALRLFVQGEVKAERAGAAGKADIEAWIDENLK